MEAVSTVAPAALRAGSANLVYRRGGQWVADTTDPAGVLETLAGRGIAVAGRRAAVVGCGGSGRAVAAALARAGANVVLSNRSRIRGEWAARRLGLPLVDLASFSAVDFNLIVNATPVGRTSEELPFACDRLSAGTVIVDLVYAPRPTPLAVAAEARGACVIAGHEVLLVQATRQFEKMTGRIIPAAPWPVRSSFTGGPKPRSERLGKPRLLIVSGRFPARCPRPRSVEKRTCVLRAQRNQRRASYRPARAFL